jgi:glycosyltransferase involved in cell wall biosynthesis
MTAIASPQFLLAQRVNVQLFPPVLHQARALADLGHVRVLDAADASPQKSAQLNERIDHIRANARGLSWAKAHHVQLLQFLRMFQREISARPAVAFGYDMDAAAALLASRALYPTIRRVVHLHELGIPALWASSRTSTVALRYLTHRLRRADLVIVPDAHRATLTAEQFRLPEPPLTVMNCPPRLDRLPQSRLLPHVHARNLPATRIVHYQGAIGTDHGLDTIIRSMPHWPGDAVLVLVGSGPQDFIDHLHHLAAAHGIDERIVWVGRVPYDEVFSYAVGAAVGLSIIAPTNDNWKYASGASNKRFEYAALGIPQVTNVGPGIDQLFTRTGIAAAVPHDVPAAISDAVTRYLTDESSTRDMAVRARRLHLTTYNYEAQFAPVIARIEQWVRSPR